MLSSSECPSDGGVSSSLLDVMETGSVAPKYSLTARACEGILVRATRRGRTLPAALDWALRRVAGQDPQGPAPSTSLVGVNPSNTSVAGTLVSNNSGGQRTTDIAGAYGVIAPEGLSPTTGYADMGEG